MDKEEFEREALRIANVIHQNYPPKLKGDTEIMEFANAISDLLEKDAAENNPPVAWLGSRLVTCDPDEVAAMEKNGFILFPLYAKPPIQQAPEGWQLVPKEPTPEMLGAGLRHVNGMASMPASYRAMLAAAPEYKEGK